jgi:hypothetical protein
VPRHAHATGRDPAATVVSQPSGRTATTASRGGDPARARVLASRWGWLSGWNRSLRLAV